MRHLFTVPVLILAATASQAAQCGPRDDVAEALREQFGEVVQVQGLSADGRLMEIWSNPGTGTWTATMTSQAGVTCLSAAGDRFQTTRPGEPA